MNLTDKEKGRLKDKGTIGTITANAVSLIISIVVYIGDPQITVQWIAKLIRESKRAIALQYEERDMPIDEDEFDALDNCLDDIEKASHTPEAYSGHSGKRDKINRMYEIVDEIEQLKIIKRYFDESGIKTPAKWKKEWKELHSEMGQIINNRF